MCKQTNKQKQNFKNERKGRRERGRKEGRVGAGKADSDIGELAQNHGKLVKYSSLSLRFFFLSKKKITKKKTVTLGECLMTVLVSHGQHPWA